VTLELEVQRYGMKKNTLTVDTAMGLMEDEWDNVKNRPQTVEVSFFENRTVESEFSVFQFWGQFGSVQFLQNRYPRHFHQVPHTPTTDPSSEICEVQSWVNDLFSDWCFYRSVHVYSII